MPELPEVETVRRGLEPVMEGALVERVELFRPDLRFPLPVDFASRMAGRRIISLGRRAKYLMAELDGAEVLAMHLGMSGSFRIVRPDRTDTTPGVFHYERSQISKHDHVIFHLVTRDGKTLCVIFNDPRRFGYMSLVANADLPSHAHFSRLGVEPTGNALSPEVLAERFSGKTAPLKAVLLDQAIIAGLGNIYVCEALWRARLSPLRKAATLVHADGTPTPQLVELTGHIRQTIADAIEAGGSSLKDYRQADGSLGYFQHSFAVYGREKHPCPRPGCKGHIDRIVQSGRSTFFCAVCQS
ncbi:bifunctional DNA-formamidopyrimidine glycosylase/DNA-(apurinic or apyrimidinic site) lyase [Aureimonas fodinaquatilis]|uniref:Formamidopyrimidine-DNA glycosylase n=1 Tax=Aureimonas fodinaquatilis TaxID=2565783 RepID=A0A5B0DZ05_9HYPH|nr:bifunctional DNA-formamidopyrimidine glycosylase/DNA-(apurinic or apyrimidinic site) lyase [Aureimonas fodinaquatilis]KAA0971676.1 bifunctional DNA-formamidopyrimidine glycosylase/DNA-(apurinic or apyrimidinic site) lyase [Aureimonas fodinaquatilis]